jgi:SAM-dependent methyltransferase
MLLEIVEPRSVIDVGCGVGAWLVECRKHGVHDVLGLDSAEMLATQSALGSNEQMAVDLEGFEPLDRRFDLALCLEVAEHVPTDSADALVNFLTEVAPVVAFSAAIPAQGGIGHVNEQWPHYWRSRFEARGFRQYDGLRSVLWNDGRVAWWYRQNLFLYSRVELALPGSPMAENVIHPELWKFVLASRFRLADVPLKVLAWTALRRVRSRVAFRLHRRTPASRPDEVLSDGAGVAVPREPVETSTSGVDPGL